VKYFEENGQRILPGRRTRTPGRRTAVIGVGGQRISRFGPPFAVLLVGLLAAAKPCECPPRRTVTRSAEEIMDIYAAFGLTPLCAWSAGQLVGCDPKTVERWVAIREAGGNPFERLTAHG
jgi:hypothetical protein